jgi:RNA polymerase sigma factor (sigma-70 family)
MSPCAKRDSQKPDEFLPYVRFLPSSCDVYIRRHKPPFHRIQQRSHSRLDKPSPVKLTQAEYTSLVERVQHGLHIFLAGLLDNEATVADILQDTLREGWEATQRGVAPFCNGHTYEEQRRWLFHAAYCNAISVRRRAHRVQAISLEETEHLPSSPRASFEERIAEAEVVRSALTNLPKLDVACLLLCVVQGMSASEAGMILGIDKSQTIKRLSRAKKRLRQAYERQSMLSSEEVHP